MEQLAALARYETTTIFWLLMATLAYQALSGRIQIAGLVRDKLTGTLDPARVQLLAVTVFTAGWTLLNFDQMREAHTIALPEGALIYLLGGSQGLYLGRKFHSCFKHKGA